MLRKLDSCLLQLDASPLVFLDAPKRVLTRESLLKGIRITGGVADRSIDVLVLRLRRKLSAVAPEDSIIATERGAGYRFAMPVNQHSLHPADGQNRQHKMSCLISGIAEPPKQI
jgi:DNA-binding winged helix-turn-helix (wHTH) protein